MGLVHGTFEDWERSKLLSDWKLQSFWCKHVKTLLEQNNTAKKGFESFWKPHKQNISIKRPLHEDVFKPFGQECNLIQSLEMKGYVSSKILTPTHLNFLNATCNLLTDCCLIKLCSSCRFSNLLVMKTCKSPSGFRV